jgi:hypothetical protein
MIFIKKKLFAEFFFQNAENEIKMAIFFTNFLRCINFDLDHLCPTFFVLLIDFKWQKDKINICKYGNSKWRPNLRWTSKRFNWIELENLVFFLIFF